MYFDIVMPSILFSVILIALFFEKKTERKLKSNFKEMELRVRDAVLLFAAISSTVLLIVFIPQMAIITVFLFSYSLLLFIFTYIFSDVKKVKVQLFFGIFGIVSFTTATVSLFSFATNSAVTYGALALYCLFIFTLIALVYEERRGSTKERWYLAVLPPALFICTYLFFNNTPIWSPYLLDIYGITFAILIILYLGTLFTWVPSLIFSGLLTIMDIILVFFTGSMVSAVKHVVNLGLPILVSLPTLPEIVTEGSRLYVSLGLGDFFFAGLIVTQTFKRFGKNWALLSTLTICISFAIFEVYLLNFASKTFPGTLMIICGWLPLVIGKELSDKIGLHKQKM